MRCSSCGTENSERAVFCQLCFTPMVRGGVRQGATVFVAEGAASRGPIEIDQDWLDVRNLRVAEHDWLAAQNRRASEAIAQGEPTESTVYALAARDAQILLTRGVWWSGGVFTLFAWLAVLRVALFDWGAQGLATRGPGSAIVLQAGLIGLVAAAAACVCAAWVGGDEAWRATLVNSVLWVIGAIACAVLVVFAGMPALQAVSVLAFGTIALAVIVPLGKGSPNHTVPPV